MLFLLQTGSLGEGWKVYKSLCSNTIHWPESEFFKDIILWLQNIEQEVLINNPSRLSNLVQTGHNEELKENTHLF